MTMIGNQVYKSQMFGLMKVSTHEKAIGEIKKALGFHSHRPHSAVELAEIVVGQRDTAKTGNTRRDTRIATLETDLAAANEKLRHAEAELKRRDDDTRVAMLAALEQPKPARKPRKPAPKKGAAE